MSVPVAYTAAWAISSFKSSSSFRVTSIVCLLSSAFSTFCLMARLSRVWWSSDSRCDPVSFSG